MTDESKKPPAGKHPASDNSAPYPVSPLAPAFGLVDLVFSMLSPADWGGTTMHTFLGSYRLENDLSWNKAEHADEDDGLITGLLDSLQGIPDSFVIASEAKQSGSDCIEIPDCFASLAMTC